MREEIAVGKTIEEARAAAIAALGVDPSDPNLTTEVLETPVKKLFRTIPAKVKVTWQEPAAPAQEQAPAAAPAPVEEAPAAQEPKEEPKKEKPKKKKESEAEEPIDIETNVKVKAAVEYLREVFAAMGAGEVEFSAVQKGEATIIKVSGDKLQVLIGRRGETMESLSYLASLVANRQEGEYIKLGLDVGGYRGKREADLQQMARRLGAKVRKSGLSHAMEPMNPYERRIIHSAISQMEGVRSESSGEGTNRHVVIYSTDPGASNLPDRSQRRGGRGGRDNRGRRDGRREGGRGQGRGGYGRRDDRRGPKKSTVPQREFDERIWDDTVPMAPARTEKINDADGFALYGKIEL